MGIYRRIEVHTWVDEKFKRLSPIQPSAQALWFYLLTGPQTGIIPGLFKAGHAAMAEDLDWNQEAFEKAFQEVLREGLVKDSIKDRLIWIPNAIKYNPPSSPNVIRSWAAALDTLPECSLRREAIEYMRKEVYLLDKKEVKGFAKAFDEVFGKALGEALPKGNENQSPNQEQKQEQKQEYKEGEAAQPPASPPPAPVKSEQPEPRKQNPLQNPTPIIVTGKAAYGVLGNVHLLPSEYSSLVKEYGESIIKTYIEKLGANIADRGKTYANHYAKIMAWLLEDKIERKFGPWRSTPEPDIPKPDETHEAKIIIGRAKARFGVVT